VTGVGNNTLSGRLVKEKKDEYFFVVCRSSGVGDHRDDIE
jgi:hypothetical protein